MTTRERGQGTVEYLGIIALAAVLVISLMIVVWKDHLRIFAEQAICTVVQQKACYDVRDVSPYERALSGTYVAMGDSFASGEGAWDYDEGTDFDDRDDLWPFNNGEEEHNRCRRSGSAYSRLLSTNNKFTGGSRFVACSGSVIKDFENPNHKETGEDPQLAALNKDVSLVTLSVGGNDLGFAEIMQHCVINGGRMPLNCRSVYDRQIARRLPEIRSETLALYQRARDKAPNARIVVVGYPPLFVKDPDNNYKNLLFAEDQRWMNVRAGALNATIASAAQEAGVEFIDPTDAFDGHGLGSKDPWFNDIIPDGPGAMPTDPSSMHPNAKGHSEFARLIQKQLEDPR